MKLIVYGTLMRGESNHHMMEGAQYIGDVVVPNAWLYHLGGYPGLVFDHATNIGGIVHGELYEVETSHVAELDRFEGAPYLYERRECAFGYMDKDARITMDHEEHAHIYEYQLDTDDKELIDLGNWKDR